MKPSSDLFDLIKKLTPPEKRYFVLNAKLHNGKKDYLQLFREVDKMEVYDEDELKARLKAKGIQFAQIHVTKNGLAKLILKSLRSFHERNNVQQKLFALMADASILEAKGLLRQCLKKLKAGYRLAEEYEFFRYQAEIQQKIINLSVRLGPKNLQEFLSVNYADLAETDAKAQLKSGTRRVAHRCFSISQLKGKLLPEELANKIADMEENELSHIEPSSGSGFFAKRNYYFAKHSLALASGIVQTQYLKKLMDAWDRRPELKKANPKNYKVDLTNYLNVCLVANEFDEFEAALSTFQSIKNKDFISEAESEQHYYHLYLLFCLNVNQINKARELIPEIEECFKKYKSVLIPSRVLTISFNVFLALFGSGDYYKAFDWLNRISETKYKQIRPDIHVFARVMELILNFELENYQYVENLYTNAYRNLKKRKQLGEFERTVLMHVRKLANTIDSRRRKMLWQKLFEKLAKITENNKGKSLTGLPEVAAWCKSRAENIPFFEAAKLI